MTEHPSKYPTALVLVIEQRECRCGEIYTLPQRHLFVEMHNHYTDRQRFYERSDLIDDELPEGLAHKHLVLSSRTNACAKCFQERLGWAPKPKRPRNIPRQFLGDTELSGTNTELKREYTLEDL